VESFSPELVPRLRRLEGLHHRGGDILNGTITIDASEDILATVVIKQRRGLLVERLQPLTNDLLLVIGPLHQGLPSDVVFALDLRRGEIIVV